MSYFIGDVDAGECYRILMKKKTGLSPSLNAEAIQDAIAVCCSVGSASHMCSQTLKAIVKWAGKAKCSNLKG